MLPVMVTIISWVCWSHVVVWLNADYSAAENSPWQLSVCGSHPGLIWSVGWEAWCIDDLLTAVCAVFSGLQPVSGGSMKFYFQVTKWLQHTGDKQSFSWPIGGHQHIFYTLKLQSFIPSSSSTHRNPAAILFLVMPSFPLWDRTVCPTGGCRCQRFAFASKLVANSRGVQLHPAAP